MKLIVGGFPKLGVLFSGVPIRISYFGVYIGVPLFWKATSYSGFGAF